MSAEADRQATPRGDALTFIVTMARSHGISAAEIAAALGEPPASTVAAERARGVLTRVLGYLGGTFVFAGIGVFVALQWDSMGPAARVIITLGSGVAACALALIAAGDARYERAATPLFLMAAALEPTGMLVAFSEYGTGGDWRWAGLITAGVMAIQFGAIFGALRQSTPLFLTIAFAALAWCTALDLADADEEVTALVAGSSLLLASVGVDRTPHRTITAPFYLLGGAAALYGLFDLVQDTPLEIVFLAAAAGLVYTSAAVRSRSLLAVSIAAILAYTGYFTGEHFADSIGWPLALVVFGLIMIGLSAMAVRIDRNYVRPR
jgi:hypothetical protein